MVADWSCGPMGMGISLQELARATAMATELGSGNSPSRKSDNLAALQRANPNPEESQSGYWHCREDHSCLWIPACTYKTKWHVPIFLYIYHKNMQLCACVLWWLCNCKALFAILYIWKIVIFCRKTSLFLFLPQELIFKLITFLEWEKSQFLDGH